MEEESWKASGGRSTQESPRSSAGAPQEAPTKHPGATREAPRGTQKAPRDTREPARRPERSVRSNRQNSYCFTQKRRGRPLSHRRERRDPHQVRSIATKVGGRKRGFMQGPDHPLPSYTARTPVAEAVWGKKATSPVPNVTPSKHNATPQTS